MTGITSITASLYQQTPIKQPDRTAPKSSVLSPSTDSLPNLATSIMADGGLGFLRSRLEEKMESMFAGPVEMGAQAGATAAASPYSTETEQSPEATAQRIVGFALNMMDTYRRQNSDLNEQDLLSGFEEVIRQGISEGFNHAQGVLDDQGLLQGQLGEDVTSTWDLVQGMLDDHFREAE